MRGWILRLGLLLAVALGAVVLLRPGDVVAGESAADVTPCANRCVVTFHEDYGVYCYPAGEWRCPLYDGEDLE